MKKLILILAAAFALLRAAADPYPNMKYWKPSEKTGYFTDGGNWDGDRVPGAGETAAVKDQGDGYRGHYVVKFPSGLTTVGSLLYFATLYADYDLTAAGEEKLNATLSALPEDKREFWLERAAWQASLGALGQKVI